MIFQLTNQHLIYNVIIKIIKYLIDVATGKIKSRFNFIRIIWQFLIFIESKLPSCNISINLYCEHLYNTIY